MPANICITCGSAAFPQTYGTGFVCLATGQMCAVRKPTPLHPPACLVHHEHSFERDDTNLPVGNCLTCGLSFETYENQDPDHEAWFSAVIEEGMREGR